MVNFGLLAAEIVSLVWGTPANFNWCCVLASLLQQRRSTEANRTLHDVWPSPGLVHYIYTFGDSCPVMQKIAKNSASGHHRTTLSVISLQLRHISSIGKNLLNSNVSFTCPCNIVNFRPLTAEICCRVWRTPTNFNGFLILAALLHGTLLVGISQTLRR